MCRTAGNPMSKTRNVSHCRKSNVQNSKCVALLNIKVFIVFHQIPPSEFTNPQKTAFQSHHFTQKTGLSRKKKGTFSARCTVYVRYLYGICTLSKRTNTVQIAYIYRTTGSAGTGKQAVRNGISDARSGRRRALGLKNKKIRQK